MDSINVLQKMLYKGILFVNYLGKACERIDQIEYGLLKVNHSETSLISLWCIHSEWKLGEHALSGQVVESSPRENTSRYGRGLPIQFVFCVVH